MAVSGDEVLDVARLARLRLSAEEASRFTEQLNAILRHMEALAEADVDDVDRMPDAIDEAAPALRAEDEAPDALARPLSEMAPAWDEGFFTVPRLAALDGDAREESVEDAAGADGSGRPEAGDAAGDES